MFIPSLSSTPPEIICQVFENLNNFSDVASLSQTSRTFYQTWCKYTSSICRTVGMRSLHNYAEAEQLLVMQSQAEGASPHEAGDGRKPIICSKRLLSNARCAAAACADWVNFCQIQDTPGAFHRGPEGSPETYMQPSECARFDRSFYILWTIGVMQDAPHLQHQAAEFLDKSTGPELCRLEEMADWAQHCNDNDFGSTGLDLRDDVWMAAYEIVSKYWKAYLKKGGPTPAPDPHYTPLSWFAFFKHTQSYLKSY